MDNEHLISKKEVLELTNISYGQFYRWKRKGLIPEAWFIRKSTFTGQETFLPREKVLERIQKIQALKDEHSLEELAHMLAPEMAGRDFDDEELETLSWISAEVREFFEEFRKNSGAYAFHDVVFLTAIEKLREQLDDEELELVASTLVNHQDVLRQGEGFHWRLRVGRKTTGRSLTKAKTATTLSVCCLFDQTCHFDALTETVVELDLHKVLEGVKLKLSGIE